MKKIKNILLLVSGVITGMLVYLNNITPSQACVYLGHANSIDCVDTIFNTAFIFLVFIPIFILSLITYFLKDEIVSAWLHFSYWWVPITMFLTIITPISSPSYIGLSWSGETTSFFMSCLFVIISLIIIIIQILKVYFLKKKNS